MKKLLMAVAMVALSALATHADPLTVIGKTIIADELPKCANGIGAPGGCVGPNGEIRKFVERNVVGPAKDLASGELGRSDQSVWRKLGLPRVRLW
ncbi:MAG: hypothetical protein E5W55_02245 [Mesorhizobium sp.]|nr:MAG: hypothetical protein E5W55_02245 [Mesorhizobium sp.]